MAQLWGGRFTKETDGLVRDFNESLSFDMRLLTQDLTGSIVHAAMLGECGIITKEESDTLVNELKKMLEEAKEGRLVPDQFYEDVHSFAEAELTRRVGDAGKKLHTGRSRNDQVALDMKLYIREEVCLVDEKLYELLEVLEKLIEEHTETYMPGFTHLQKAQPVTLSHHLDAYFEMFRRDRDRLGALLAHMLTCPLGSGALAGTTYPLDRYMTALKLGFTEPTRNSMDGVSDRDYVLEFLSALSICMMHLSRFSEEIILWNSQEYGYITLDDAYSTGSSIMPQKKNPDIAELVRGKTGRVYGALIGLLTTMKSLPLAYNKDMQEDKELTFDAIDTVKNCLTLFKDMLATTTFNRDVMAASAVGGFANATDAADYLVGKGIPFREAHGIAGNLVLYAIDHKCSLDDIPLDVYQGFSPLIESDIYEAISLKTCVDGRKTVGGPAEEAMKEAMARNKIYLDMYRKLGSL